MKASFKPLGLAAAVAAASAGFAGVANAQSVTYDGWQSGVSTDMAIAGNGIGDAAWVPYYTVSNGWTTGISVINTSEYTQVVKVRLRRGSDSMDALDINLVMSPKDVWTANIREEGGDIYLVTEDTTCTVPAGNDGEGRFKMAPLYREGAEEGYIEIIGMGKPDAQWGITNEDLNTSDGERTGIAQAAKHVNGEPRSCESARQNFFSQNSRVLDDQGLTAPDYGQFNPGVTRMEWWDDLDDVGDDDVDPDLVEIYYEDAGDFLRVSYLIRDAESGIEFGNEALHLTNFSDEPMMSNQQFGLFAGDFTGFDFPDLNGGSPVDYTENPARGNQNRSHPGGTPTIGGGTFEQVRRIMGIETVMNDWSTNPGLGVATDWVVTFPGQYTMLDYYLYTVGEVQGLFDCGEENPADDEDEIGECDFRDLPVRAEFVGTFDREEGEPPAGEGGLVVSPSIPGQSVATRFEYEVNTVEWTDGDSESVFGSQYAVSVDVSALDQPFGWAELAVSSDNETSDGENRAAAELQLNGGTTSAPAICDFPPLGETEDVGLDDPLPQWACVEVVNEGIPMIGFVAWERSFPNNPDRNYGRIVEHAWTSASED